MTDRRSFDRDRDRRSYFRNREADLCLKKRSQVDRDRGIWGSTLILTTIGSSNSGAIYCPNCIWMILFNAFFDAILLSIFSKKVPQVIQYRDSHLQRVWFRSQPGSNLAQARQVVVLKVKCSSMTKNYHTLVKCEKCPKLPFARLYNHRQSYCSSKEKNTYTQKKGLTKRGEMSRVTFEKDLSLTI